jgi:putative flippase GtrA
MIAKLTRHFPPGQFLRYLLVGGWNTIFGYATYALFTALLMPRVRFGYIAASALSSVINITVAYLGYKFFVFKTRGNYLAEWLRCMAVYGSGMLPGLLLLPLLVAGLHYAFHLQRSGPYVAGALLMACGVVYSFVGHRLFTFRVPTDAARDAAAEGPMQQIASGLVGEETKIG